MPLHMIQIVQTHSPLHSSSQRRALLQPSGLSDMNDFVEEPDLELLFEDFVRGRAEKFYSAAPRPAKTGMQTGGGEEMEDESGDEAAN